MKKTVCTVAFILAAVVAAGAQTHSSLSLGGSNIADNGLYRALEIAELRGLTGSLSAVKPWSRSYAVSVLREALAADNPAAGRLSASERRIMEDALKQYTTPPPVGIDWKRLSYSFAENAGDFRLTGDLDFSAEAAAGAARINGSTEWGTDNWFAAAYAGDMGNHFSYGLTLAGVITRAPRSTLGRYDTYYAGFGEGETTDSTENNVNRRINSYSQSLAFLPYTYRKRWDGFVFDVTNISTDGQTNWPDSLSVGYSMTGEIFASFLEDHLSFRAGRFDREWGGMARGSSLVLNANAQPFVALETVIRPLSWLTFSSLTGILEYDDEYGIKRSSGVSQNAYSLSMVELNFKKYLHLDFGSTTVWPKRFELGYLFPLFDNFFYQNNVGDFDNAGLFFNIKGRLPGTFDAWFSFFLDEINVEQDFRHLDRAMFAYQAGTAVNLPFLPFATASLRYTKVEPYTYTHTREFVPWYGNALMETPYTTGGSGIGYYLPPNSDEVLFRVETLPALCTSFFAQYQMVRHGADYGSRAVDGSSYYSELDPDGRSEKAVLRKYFLEDGAYQWQHILQIGGEHTFDNANIKLFGTFGIVFSSFTDIDDAIPPNSGEGNSYSPIDTAEYPKTTSLVGTVGVRIFPR